MSACSQLLSSGAVSPDVLVDRHYPTSALTRTTQHGLHQFSEELLKRGATVRLRYVHTHTHTYARTHFLSFTHVCIFHVQVSPSGPADQIPLLVAAENGHTDILQLLVAHRADVNVQVHVYVHVCIVYVYSFLPHSLHH